MRRLWPRIAAWLAVAIVVLLAVGTLAPRPFFAELRPTGAQVQRILVLTNPIHTDIALPLTDDLRLRFDFVRSAGVPVDAPGARYLLVGWGGRDFYMQTPTWSDLKLVPLLKGITIDRSVLHIEATGDIAQDAQNVVAHDLTRAEFDRLIAFVEGSFSRSAAGPIAIENAGYGDHDAFYEANGAFTAILGCNIWAAAALRAGGLRTGWWNPLPALLVFSMRLYN